MQVAGKMIQRFNIFHPHPWNVSLKYHLLKIFSAGYLWRSWRQRNLRQGSAGGGGDEKGVRVVGSKSHCIDYLCYLRAGLYHN